MQGRRKYDQREASDWQSQGGISSLATALHHSGLLWSKTEGSICLYLAQCGNDDRHDRDLAAVCRRSHKRSATRSLQRPLVRASLSFVQVRPRRPRIRVRRMLRKLTSQWTTQEHEGNENAIFVSVRSESRIAQRTLELNCLAAIWRVLLLPVSSCMNTLISRPRSGASLEEQPALCTGTVCLVHSVTIFSEYSIRRWAELHKHGNTSALPSITS